MKFSYRVELEDIVAFSQYYYQENPIVRRTLRRRFWIVSIVGLAVFLYLCLMKNYWFMVIWATYIFAMLFLLNSRVFFKRRVHSSIEKSYKSAKNLALFGPGEMEFSEEIFLLKRPGIEMKCAWRVVEKIESTSDHLFIYSTPATAHIIPRGKLENPKLFPQIVAEAQRLYQQAQGGNNANSLSL